MFFNWFKKGKKIYSIIYNLCPKCHSSPFWPSSNPYKNIIIKNKGDIGFCKKCNLKYEVEPGFWFGAMYISYAISIFISLSLWVFLNYLFSNISITNIIIIIASFLLLCSPITYYLSRLLWINIFVSYDSKYK